MKNLLIILLTVGIGTGANAQFNVLTDEATSIEILPDGMYFNRSNTTLDNTNAGVGVGVFKSYVSSNRTSRNTAMGYQSAMMQTDGFSNVSVGASAMGAIISASDCVFLGAAAGGSGAGNRGTGVGFGALSQDRTYGSVGVGYLSSLSDNEIQGETVAIGALSRAVASSTTSETYVGFSSGQSAISTYHNRGIGAKALQNSGDSESNIAVGYNAMNLVGEKTEGNVAIGANTLSVLKDPSLGFHPVTNVAIGKDAMRYDTTSQSTVAIGREALLGAQNGQSNVAIGTQALRFLKSGSDNIGIGYRVGGYSQFFNIVFGLKDAFRSVLIGYKAGVSLGDFFSNGRAPQYLVAIGSEVLKGTSNADDNSLVDIIAVGAEAGGGITQVGSSSVFVGSKSRSTVIAITNSVALGYETEVTASNMIALGNASVTSIGGYAAFTMSSDRRLKKNIRYNNSLGLNFVRQLQTADYEYIKSKNGRVYNGLIAQDVQQVLEKSNQSFSGLRALENSDKTLRLSYEMLTIPLINSTNELHQQLTSLKGEVSAFRPIDLVAAKNQLNTSSSKN